MIGGLYMAKVAPRDPHMKSPWPRMILIAIIILILVFVVAPKAIEIYNDNLDETSERASNS